VHDSKVQLPREVTVTNERLTEELARRVMGWRLAPGRFLRSGGSWTARWRFRPMFSTDDAFRLLDGAGADYTLTATAGGKFTAEVRVGDGIGAASGAQKAETITVALARALGLEI
jgi:hypothetical protein